METENHNPEDATEIDVGSSKPVMGRRINWKAIELLMFITLLMGFGGYQLVSSQRAGAQGSLPPDLSYGIRITKYASPADGTDFIFNCESEDVVTGADCPSATFTLSDTDSSGVESSQYLDILNSGDVFTITEQVPSGWALVATCDTSFSGAVTPVENGFRIDLSGYGTYCNFSNYIPSQITVVKDTTPPVGTNYAFTGTLGDFTLDDAAPDDLDAITDTIVFTGLQPGPYSISESDGSELTQVSCTIDGQPVSYNGAVRSSLPPAASGFVYSYSNNLTLYTYSELYRTSSDEARALLEFETPDASIPYNRHKLQLHISDYYNCLPVPVEVYAYAGDGVISTTDFFEGDFVQALSLSNNQKIAEIDVTDFVSGLISSNIQYVGFNLRYPSTLSYGCPTGISQRSSLISQSPWGVQVDLEGDQDVVCTFVNDDPSVRVNVEKVVVGNAPESGWEFTYNVSNSPIVDEAVQIPAAGGIHYGQPFMLQSADGIVTINETIRPGYIVESSCDNGAVGNESVSYVTVPGDDVTCTFTNTQSGMVWINKITDPAGDDQSFDFTLTGPGILQNFALSDGEQYDSGYLPLGVYSITEQSVIGYEIESAACSEGTPDSFTITPGSAVTCTFTNRLVPEPAASVTKTVGTDPATCGASQELQVKAGDSVYFCFTLQNTGNVTLTEHTLVDANVGLSVTFDYELAPNESVQVTNAVLESLGEQPLLGPVTVTGDIVNTVQYRSADGELVADDNSTATVVLAPTTLEEEDMPDKNPNLFLPQIIIP